MNRVAYYVPTIPDVWSTDRYQHALALLEQTDHSILVSNNEIPKPLRDRSDDVHIVDSNGVLAKAREAKSVVKSALNDHGTFVTSYHYEVALSGILSKRDGIRWVPDIYETPAQYRLNQPKTYHQLTSRGLELLLDRANRSVHSFHPDTPYQYGSERRFLTNGAPVSRVNPMYPDQTPIRLVWVGSPRLDRGGEFLIRALKYLSPEFAVSVYGSVDARVEQMAEDAGVEDQISFHGWVEHSEALDAIRNATVGYAVLPSRTDWKYAPAIKIGEYLAGGTIPLVSRFPGSRYVAGDAGYYVEPRWQSVADALSALASESPSKRRERMQRARSRGEEIPWKTVRADFVDAVFNS